MITEGAVMDVLIEQANDGADYEQVATQSDFDEF